MAMPWRKKLCSNGVEGVDGRAVGVEDHELVAVAVGSHAVTLIEQCDGFVTVPPRVAGVGRAINKNALQNQWFAGH